MRTTKGPVLAIAVAAMAIAAGCGDKKVDTGTATTAAQTAATTAAATAAETGGAASTTATATEAASETASTAASETAAGTTVAAGQPQKGGTITVGIDSIDHLDPALWYYTTTWTIAGLTCTTMLVYPDQPGDAGKELVPGLAELPQVSDGGRTYTFAWRPGTTFANGQPVTPADMKYTIERALAPSMQGPAPYFWSDLVGADEIAAGTATEAPGLVATDDSLTITLKEPSGSLLSRVGMKWLCPVPKGTPVKPIEDGSLLKDASTGPYVLESYTPSQEMVLVRNPKYAADVLGERGYADRFELPIVPKSQQTFEEVKAGQLDAHIGALDGTEASQALDDASLEGRVFANPESGIRYIWMNEDVPPFDNVKVRQAVNYAIDRTQIVKVLGGPAVAQPTDQIMPPTMAGWRDYEAYPNTPDLAKAKQLMQESGVKTPVAVKADVYDGDVDQQVAQVVQADLKEIGIELTFHVGPTNVLDPQQDKRANRVPMGAVAVWTQDYPNGDDFFTPLLDPRFADQPGHKARLDDASLTADFVAAQQETDPAKQADLYQALDEKVMRENAPWAPLYVPTVVQVVSDRVDGYVYHPVYNRINLATLYVK